MLGGTMAHLLCRLRVGRLATCDHIFELVRKKLGEAQIEARSRLSGGHGHVVHTTI